MSKSKVPTLPPNASRSAIIAFRDKVRTYARDEYELGATPDEVYERVARGGQLWALRNSIDAEYLDFLGVPRKKARVLAVMSAMATYFVLAGFAPPSIPALRFGVPVLVAMLMARIVEVQATSLMRKGREAQRVREKTDGESPNSGQ